MNTPERIGSFVIGEEDTQSIPFAKQHVRRCMGMWISNGLHHLWCEAGQCYVASEECACKFCGCAELHVNRDNLRQIVKVLHIVIGLHTCM